MDYDLINPVFAKHIQRIIEKLKTSDNLLASPYSGFRSPMEQAKIYSVGRVSPGEIFTVEGITVTAPTLKEYPKWGIITHASPFLSAHQWGLAVDFGWMINGKLHFDPLNKADWQKLYQTASTEYCEDITKFVPGDLGHIQWLAWHTIKNDLDTYKSIYLQTNDMKKVWLELDKHYPIGH